MSEIRRFGSPSSPDSLLNPTRRNYEVAKILKTGPSSFNPSGTSRINPDEISLHSSTASNDIGAQFPDERPSIASGKTEDMSKPVLFYGKASQIDDLDTYCKVTFIADSIISEVQKAGIAAKLFRGAALSWLTTYMSHNELNDYEELIAQVRSAFGLSEAALNGQYARQLATCRQKKDVQHYALEFVNLATKVGLPEAAKKAQFIQGLKGNLQRAIVTSDDYTNFDDLVEECIRIDSELYNVARRSRTMGDPSKSGNKYNRRGHSGRDKSGKFTKRED